MIKKGQIFYKAWINVESNLKEKSTVEFSEWHVTSCNAGGIYLREKCFSTWGKLSKKNKDYGWLPLSSFAKQYCVKHFISEEELKKYFSCSKSAAYRKVLPEAKKYKKDATRILTQIEKAILKHTKK